jgi:hypothetical protein
MIFTEFQNYLLEKDPSLLGAFVKIVKSAYEGRHISLSICLYPQKASAAPTGRIFMKFVNKNFHENLSVNLKFS